MAHKQTRPWSHSEFRHRSQIPMPAVAEVEQRLLDVLTPSLLAPRQLERHYRLAAPTAHPHAATAPDAARHRGHHGELGVAAGAVHRRGAEAARACWE